MFDDQVTFNNAPEKLLALGQALNIETRTRDEIRRQELANAASFTKARLLLPFTPLNVPG